MEVLGIDIGGSGIKGALVDTETGKLTTERFRVETPQPANEDALTEAVAEIINHFSYQGIIGVGFPGVVLNGTIKTAANIAKTWINIDAALAFKNKANNDFYIVNDADAAGLAEVKFGTTITNEKIVLFLTVGTGIGTALFTNGVLLPNTELGHIKLKTKLEAEHYASDAARKTDDLNWKKWGKRFNEYLEYMDSLFWPEVIIVGGGISKKFDKFEDQLKINQKTKIIPASLLNEAGIIGAAYYAFLTHEA